MPKILYSSASPYSAKARMAATHAGYAFESVDIDTNAGPEILVGNNPLGKIPVLITDDGRSVYDSRAITQFINRETRNALFPRNAAKRTEAETLEALADGIADCLLAHVYERRFRPAEKIEQSWLDKQWTKVTRALDQLNATPPRLPVKITAGHIALRATLGYLSLRFEGKWERGRARLVRWTKRFDEKFPELAALLPK
ncbi:MAG: glutathione S-transferase family protein [Notoacmeibacter sp.]|nr:glutathione S-transferase family protein [Notoacmeibacter sp.]